MNIHTMFITFSFKKQDLLPQASMNILAFSCQNPFILMPKYSWTADAIPNLVNNIRL